MPIKGLTDRGLAFPEIGRIRKGAKKTGNRPGEDLTYFRVEFDEAERETAALFVEKFGPKPQEIRIVLPFNEIERMWDAWLEGYTAGRMVARSDGEIFTYLVDTQSGEILVKNGVDVKTGQARPYVEGKPVGYYTSSKTGEQMPVECKPRGRLKVIIPELQRAAYMTVLTTSIHDIINISEQLEAFKQLNGGQLSGIPLLLRRRPKEISTPSQGGKRARRVKWLISIEADPEWVRRRLAATKQAALPGNGFEFDERAALPEHIEEGEYSEVEYDEGELDLEEMDFEPLPFDLQLVIEAGQTTTPKGTRLMDLEPDQLSMVVDKSKGTLGDAAELLLNLATEAALAALVEVGGDPLPETTTNLELVNAYCALDQA